MDCSSSSVWIACLGVVALVALVVLVVLVTLLTGGRDVSNTWFLGLTTGSLSSLVDTVVRKTGFLGLTSGRFSTRRSRASPGGIGVGLLRIALLNFFTGSLVVVESPRVVALVLVTLLTGGSDVSNTGFLGSTIGSLLDTVICTAGFLGLTSGRLSTLSRPSPGIGVGLLRIALLNFFTGCLCLVVVVSVLGVVKVLPGHPNQLQLEKKYCEVTVVVLLGLGDVLP